jgi:arsenate reductase (thioredoxin)
MYKGIANIIADFSDENINAERRKLLQPLVQYIQAKYTEGEIIRLNFICTHNSRRSHLAQIWAQTMAYYFGIHKVFCYSGGTETTAMFPKAVQTLVNHGFQIHKLSDTDNPVYAVKFSENEHPVICFSKVYNDPFNPVNKFGAVVTCNSADEACPVVFGAEQRFPVKYDDPKSFDGTELVDAKYAERSMEIAEEMYYVFAQIKKNHV